MNLPQELINILAGLAFSVGGWFARVIWVAVRDLEKDLARLREDLPRVYLPRARRTRRSTTWRTRCAELRSPVRDAGQEGRQMMPRTSRPVADCPRQQFKGAAGPSQSAGLAHRSARAWSLRLILLAGLLTGCEAVLSAMGTEWCQCRCGRMVIPVRRAGCRVRCAAVGAEG